MERILFIYFFFFPNVLQAMSHFVASASVMASESIAKSSQPSGCSAAFQCQKRAVWFSKCTRREEKQKLVAGVEKAWKEGLNQCQIVDSVSALWGQEWWRLLVGQAGWTSTARASLMVSGSSAEVVLSCLPSARNIDPKIIL